MAFACVIALWCALTAALAGQYFFFNYTCCGGWSAQAWSSAPAGNPVLKGGVGLRKPSTVIRRSFANYPVALRDGDHEQQAAVTISGSNPASSSVTISRLTRLFHQRHHYGHMISSQCQKIQQESTEITRTLKCCCKRRSSSSTHSSALSRHLVTLNGVMLPRYWTVRHLQRRRWSPVPPSGPSKGGNRLYAVDGVFRRRGSNLYNNAVKGNGGTRQDVALSSRPAQNHLKNL